MEWKRNGSVHASGQYVIEPHTSTYGVVRYRLIGGGLDELSRSVPKLKELAESHQRRVLADAADQRKLKIELAKQRSSIEQLQAEIRERVSDVLPTEEERQPDWSELAQAEAQAEALDRTRRESAELFARRQERARREADGHRQAEIRNRIESVLTPDEEEYQPDWSELTAAEAEDRRRRESAELFEQRQNQARREADDTDRRRRALLRSRRSENYPEVCCPGCKADLNADDRSFVEDTDLVRYRCVQCGMRSAWDFDTPVPIRVA